MSAESRFHLAHDPAIEIYELARKYNADTNPNKVNLAGGCKSIN